MRAINRFLLKQIVDDMYTGKIESNYKGRGWFIGVFVNDKSIDVNVYGELNTTDTKRMKFKYEI